MLRALVPRQHWLARTGADEFLIVMEGSDDPDGDPDADAFRAGAEELGQHLQEALEQSLPLRGRSRSRFTASCGIAVHRRGRQDGRTLLIQASSALCQAKEQGPGNLCLFSQEPEEKLQQQLTLKRGLDQALSQNALALQYKAKVDRLGRWIGAEGWCAGPGPTAE